MPTILLTNDDGYTSIGLKEINKTLSKLGRVIVVAPCSEQSGVSHSITISRPLRIKELSNNGSDNKEYCVDGTPADCVKTALSYLLKFKPDLLVSGINRGANTGININYSGTIAGAAEGTLSGIPSMAISRRSFKEDNFEPAAIIGAHIASLILKHGLPGGTLLNVNIPYITQNELKGFAITYQGGKHYHDFYEERRDPRNKLYLWLKPGNGKPSSISEGSDSFVIRNNYVSVTPIKVNRTDETFANELQRWNIEEGFSFNNEMN